MKKATISLAMAVCMLLFGSGVPTFAASAKTSAAKAGSGIHVMLTNTDLVRAHMSFSGDKAQCVGIVYGKKGTSHIRVNAYLMQVNGNRETVVKGWTLNTNSDTLEFEKDYYVASGHTYEFEVDAAVTRNGTTEYVSSTVRGYCG